MEKRNVVLCHISQVPMYAVFRYDGAWWRKMTAINALSLTADGEDYDINKDDRIFNEETVGYVRC